MCTKWNVPLAISKTAEGVPISWEAWVRMHSLWGLLVRLGKAVMPRRRGRHAMQSPRAVEPVPSRRRSTRQQKKNRTVGQGT